MPEPHLKSIPSVFARFEDAFEVILDGVDKAGGALRVTVGLGLLLTLPVAGSQYQPPPSEWRRYLCHRPQLNQTGELKAAFWRTRMCVSSS